MHLPNAGLSRLVVDATDNSIPSAIGKSLGPASSFVVTETKDPVIPNASPIMAAAIITEM